MSIDLSICEEGDILISKNGTRVNSGHVMKNENSKLPEDIVEIIKINQL